MSSQRPDLEGVLDNIPTRSGVYFFKDSAGKVLYVGKAAVLKHRVRSYFQASQTPKHWHLAQEVGYVDFIVTDSEVEALILENNLIKRYRPRYNVRFKDDKRYPYIKVNWQNDFPKVEMVRQIKRDGARYYGPFASSGAMYETLDVARRIFPHLTCNRVITGKDPQPCLYYHIGWCAAPCIGAIDKEGYRKIIEGLCRFLEGHYQEVVDSLRAQMQGASERLDFERAARLRDQIHAVERTMTKQRMVSRSPEDQDVIALARSPEGGHACVQVFFVRSGKLIGRESFILEGTEGEEERLVLSSFLKQFYDGVAYIPGEILLGGEIEESEIIRSWLEERREGKVNLSVPQRGPRKELADLAHENAAQTLVHLEAKAHSEEGAALEALAELQEQLGLDEIPTRIECYDISNIQGRMATASMVVFQDGRAQKAAYRQFRVRAVEGPNDYAMLQEVLRRRFAHALARDASDWTLLPDLLIVDGGKGQLSAAQEVLEEHGLGIPLAALAKEREEIFLPDRREPILLPEGSAGLHLMQRIRDEAHRFAIGYHQKLRRKGSLTSILEEIPGVGSKRRKALLKHFGSLEAIRQASLQELAEVEGMNEIVAARVQEFLAAQDSIPAASQRESMTEAQVGVVSSPDREENATERG